MLLEKINEVVNLYPNDIAIIDDSSKYTFKELYSISKKIANRLDKLGLKKGDYLTIEIERSIHYVASMIASWMKGITFAALDKSYPKDRLDYIANDCNAKIRINEEFLKDIDKELEIKEICKNEAFDTSLLVYTSGSTGNPKGVIHTHQSMYDTVIRGDIAFDSANYKKRGQIMGLPIPFSFIAGLALLFGSITDATTTFIIPYNALKNPSLLSKIISENNISISYIPPKILKLYENKNNTLKLAITGSEKISNIYRRDLRIINGYGSSETAGGIIFFEIDKKYDNTPIGKTLYKEKAYVLDDNLNEVSEGELCLSGNFALGYFNLEEQTNKQFIKNPFKDIDGFDILYKTGDIVKLQDDGNIVYLNRKDWMLKINGLRVEPGEISKTILELEEIHDCVIKDFNASAGQTIICAYYVLNENKSINELKIKEYLKTKLPDYMIPSYFIKLDKIPLNKNGKLDRASLIAPKIAEIKKEYVPARNDLDLLLINAFEKVLNISDIGINDDFFLLGGDSIKVFELQQILPNIGLSTKLIYEKKTIKDISDNLEIKKIKKADLNKEYKLTQAQLGIYFASIKNEGKACYNNPILFKLPNKTDIKKLKSSIKNTILAHKGLLAKITLSDDGIPYMKYNKDFINDEICEEINIKDSELEKLKSKLEEPFYILKERLFRFKIFMTETTKYLFMDIHHIIFDGFSFHVLLNDIINSYNGKDILDETYTAFDESIREENERLSDNYLKSKDWYLKTFSDVDNVSLPDGDIKSNEIIYGLNKIKINIKYDIIKDYCINNKTTENVLTTLAFSILLSAYTMNKTVAFATVYNGRHDVISNNTVSMFVKTLPILTKLDKNIKISEALNNLKDEIMSSMTNDIYSFAELKNATNYTSDVLFTWQGDLFEMPQIEDEKLEIVDIPFNATGEKLSIQIYPSSDGYIEMNLQYHKNLFSEKFIKDLSYRYENVLNNLLTKEYIYDVSLINDKELNELIKLSYGGDLKYDNTKTFIDLFIETSKKYKDNIAVVDKSSNYTYKELDRISNIVANYLKDKGIKKNDFVAIKMERIKEFIAAIIAIEKIGAAYIPIDPEYPIDRINYMLEDSNAKFVFTKESFDEIINNYNNDNYINNTDPLTYAYMIYTSGSTGKPKGVVISHKALRALISWTTNDLNITNKSRNGAHASFSFDASVIDIFPILAVGGSLYILDETLRMDLDLIYDYIIKNKLTSFCSSTAIGMSLINAHPDLNIEYMMMGGEKMLPTKKVNFKLVNGYGPTEFAVASSYHIVNQDKDKDIPIGKAVKNTYSFICDPFGNLLPQGMIGELCLLGDQIANCYLNRLELTNERFIDSKIIKDKKMYKTGDLAKYNDDNLLEYVGRIDFQVKLRGFRIELGEIENCAIKYEGIKQAAAEVKSNQLVLYYTSSKDIDENLLKEEMSKSLTEYMVPNIFMKLDEMPLTPNGKINRKILPVPKLNQEIIKPRNDLEKEIYDSLKNILGYEDFGVTSDFNTIGLTSLSAMQLSAKLTNILSKTVRVNDLENYDTIEKLANYISNKDNDNTYELQEFYPLTMAQKGILTEVLQQPFTTVYNIPTYIDIPKDIDIDKLILSIKKAIDMHPYLKMKFVTDNNGDILAKRCDNEIPVVDIYNNITDIYSLIKPFDLFKERIYRAIIIKNKDINKFFFDCHHIAFDGESADIFLNDVSKIYDGISVEKEKYTLFEEALDEKQRHEGKLLEDAKNWYYSLFDGRDVDSIPINDINNKNGKKEFTEKNLKIDINKVNNYLNQNKLTINSLWISSFGLALARFLNRNDAIFTTVYNGRGNTNVINSVGMFVHTLPVLTEPFKFDNSIDYIKSMASQIKKSMANDIYGFMEIAHDLDVRADILFVYEGNIGSKWKLDNKELDIKLMPSDSLKSKILITISEAIDGYNLYVEFDGKLYESFSINSLIDSTIMAFNALINNEKPEDISLIDNNTLNKLIEFNKTESNVIKTDILSKFMEMKDKYPNNLAIIYDDIKLTYKEVDEISDNIAAYLFEKGVKKGDVISILIKRSINMIICPLAAMKLGCAYEPLDSTYPSERLEFMINDANSKYVIADSELLDKIKNIKLPILHTKDINNLDKKAFNRIKIEPESLMILLYTSGTTGTPKGVMLSHFNIVNFAAWYKNYYKLDSNSVVLAYASFGFDACMMDLYPALTNGAAVCIVPEDMRMNLNELKEYMGKNKVTHAFMTTQVGRMFAEENSECYTLKHLSVGGEKLVPLNTLPTGYKFYNGYGPTECSIFSTIEKYDKPYDRIPIGRPLDNYKLYVVSSNKKLAPIGALGELWISGFGVGIGYLNQEEKTKTTFVKNPFNNDECYEIAYKTGDIVRWLDNGKIDFVGRNDGQVKIRGFRIELSEVEMTIRQYPNIKDVTVQAFKDEKSGQMYLAAYFTASSYINVDKIKEFITSQKPPYMVPSSIMQLEEIPLNQNQKVNKRALPKPVFVSENNNFIEAKTQIEKDIVNIYSSILGVDKVSVTDSFFNIGGTSLTAAKVIMQAINKGYSIAYKDVFDNPSARELAKLIEERKNISNNTNNNQEEINTNTIEALKYNDVKYVDEIKKDYNLGTVLLTGATGFLGIHILKELLNLKNQILVLVRGKETDALTRLKGFLTYYFDSPLDDELNKYVKVINGDITDDNLINQIKDYKFDTIINAAACVKHFAQDDIIERINVGGVKNLIEIAKQKGTRLIQVSTLSVAGENVDHKLDSNYLMKENELYFGQDISNKYVNSKFKAEEAILNAIDNDNLDAKIIRVGNLMSRQSDGEFQINSITNAFMKNLKGYKVIGMFPISMLDAKIDFSPIDEIAKTILLLSQTPKKFTVFHSANSHQVQMGDVIDAINLAGIKIDKVSDDVFNNKVHEIMQDEKKSMLISSLLSYANSDNHTYELVQADFTFTVKALYRLGYRWPITDFNYLTQAIKSLDSLEFFDRLDM